jgi:hypothetical protein
MPQKRTVTPLFVITLLPTNFAEDPNNMGMPSDLAMR